MRLRVLFVGAVFWLLSYLLDVFLEAHGWRPNLYEEFAFTIAVYAFCWIVTALTWKEKDL